MGARGRHRRVIRRRRYHRRYAVAVASAVAIAMSVPVSSADAAPARPAAIAAIDNAALSWAETQTGAPYVWGGAGPYWSGYDCSGLVVAAFAHEGITLPHSTYMMLGNWHLVRTWYPKRGDLAFYGSGHVEFVTVWYHTTFGAHTFGEPVSWAHWSGWWAPTAFYEVVP